jgi:hypothetical protein
MDAARIIAGWKQRLIALAANPEFAFRDTPQHYWPRWSAADRRSRVQPRLRKKKTS